MFPHERSLVKKYAGKPFVLLGVNSDKTPELVAKSKKDNQLTWLSFFDGGKIGGPIATQWGVRGWPTVYVIDQKGIIRATNVRGTSLDAAIEKLLPADESSNEK